MTENEAIVFIKNANELSKKAIHNLEQIKDKAERIGKIGEYYANLENCYKEIESCEIAVKALEEIQQYRAIGTVEEIEPYVRLGEKLNLCDLVRENAKLVKKIQHLEVYEKQLKEYEAIGTVEECRAAMERKKPQPPDIWGDGYDKEGNIIYDMYDCPGCGQSYEIDDKYKHCPECGQAINWGGAEDL